MQESVALCCCLGCYVFVWSGKLTWARIEEVRAYIGIYIRLNGYLSDRSSLPIWVNRPNSSSICPNLAGHLVLIDRNHHQRFGWATEKSSSASNLAAHEDQRWSPAMATSDASEGLLRQVPSDAPSFRWCPSSVPSDAPSFNLKASEFTAPPRLPHATRVPMRQCGTFEGLFRQVDGEAPGFRWRPSAPTPRPMYY
jgi:hypothetical protein